SADVAVYARVLTESLDGSLPAGVVTGERDRSMSDRMRGGPGGGCRGTRQPVQIQEWAAELARALVSYAEQNAQAAEALRRLVTGGYAGTARNARPRPAPSAPVSPRGVRRLGGS